MSAHGEHPNPNPHDDPAAESVLFVGVVGTIIFVATVIFITALVYAWGDATAEATYVQAPNSEVERLHHSQMADISGSYRWAGDDREHVVIPIEQAMQVVAAELRAGGGAMSAGE